MSVDKLTITAAGQWLEFRVEAVNAYSGKKEGSGLFDVSVSGMNGGEVTLQRRFDAADSYKTVEAITEDVEYTAEVATTAFYRIGVDTGNLGTATSITVEVRQ